MLIRGRILLPITAPPIEDGAVVVSNGRIEAVGRHRDLQQAFAGPSVDLGEVILMPGLVNAHCHLDYTRASGSLPRPSSFTTWIQTVLSMKAHWSYSDYAESWIVGARQLVESGCTTVLDCEAVPELLPEVWASTPLRVISAIELTGVRSRRPPAELVGGAVDLARQLRHARNSVALAPHAPYSTLPGLLEEVARTAREHDLLVTIHAAESIEEYEMFRHARGPMYEWLGPQRGTDDCGIRSPVEHIERAGLLGPKTVLVHVNHLDPDDAQRIARAGAGVVHCPRSHAYFGHEPFPWPVLARAGVRVSIGSDSLLSVTRRGAAPPRLDLFAELAVARRTLPEVEPHSLLRMVTTVPAAMLGLEGRIGALAAGASADVIAVPYSGHTGEAAEAVVHQEGPVSASMIEGEWAIRASAVALAE